MSQQTELQDLRDLLEYDLSVLLNAERLILGMLPVMAQESKDVQIRDGFTHHETQTRQQIENLERCCKLLQFQPKDLPCRAIEGLKQDHDAFAQQKPAPDVQEMFDLDAALKTEHFEIACYRGLIVKATLLAQQEVVALLNQNLAQEEEMARQIEAIAPLLGHKAIASAGMRIESSKGNGNEHTRRDEGAAIGEGNQTDNTITGPAQLRHPTEQRLEEAGVSAATAQAQREEAGDVR